MVLFFHIMVTPG